MRGWTGLFPLKGTAVAPVNPPNRGPAINRTDRTQAEIDRMLGGYDRAGLVIVITCNSELTNGE